MKRNLVVLVVPPSETFRQAEEHLGVGYLSAALKERGISCEIIDGFLCQIDTEEIKEKILALRPQVVGFSLYQDSLKSFSEIAAFIRKEMAFVHITAGGFLASFNFDWLFPSFPGLIDSVVVGEGEITFSELAEKIIVGKDWHDTQGIAFRENGRTLKSQVREKISNLDYLPFPDRPALRDTLLQMNPVHICASRGCYGNCTFCSVNSYGQLNGGGKWRGRSIGNIIDEIEMLIKKHGANCFKFIDDCFFPSRNKSEWVEEFCRELDSRALKISFRMSCRVDDVEYDIFKLLKEHGLFSVSLGVESIVARQLQEWKKGVTPEQNMAALEVCRQLGIIVQMGYIMLDRDSTLEELKLHLDFLERCQDTVTKGIYSLVFAAQGTKLAGIYMEKEGKLERRGINFDYRFKSEEISEIASALKKWAKAYGDTYSWAIDSLSAPKAIPGDDRTEIHRVIMALKGKELEIFRRLIEMADVGNIFSADSFINQKIEENKDFMASIEGQLTDFYDKKGLPHRKGRNLYIK